MVSVKSVLWCAVGAAAAWSLAGCSGQSSARVDGAGAAGPVIRSTDDYRKVRFDEAWRGLRIEDGLLVADTGAARDLQIGDAAGAVARGDALMEENDFTGAIGAYRLAVLAGERELEALMGIGYALLGKKKDDMALAAFRSATVVAPEDTDARMMYADALNRVGDLDGWARELENVLALEPEHGEAHARLAVAKHYLGDREGARREVALAERFGGAVPPQLKEMLKD